MKKKKHTQHVCHKHLSVQEVQKIGPLYFKWRFVEHWSKPQVHTDKFARVIIVSEDYRDRDLTAD
jgi:hypothetical protein